MLYSPPHLPGYGLAVGAELILGVGGLGDALHDRDRCPVDGGGVVVAFHRDIAVVGHVVAVGAELNRLPPGSQGYTGEVTDAVVTVGEDPAGDVGDGSHPTGSIVIAKGENRASGNVGHLGQSAVCAVGEGDGVAGFVDDGAEPAVVVEDPGVVPLLAQDIAGDSFGKGQAVAGIGEEGAVGVLVEGDVIPLPVEVGAVTPHPDKPGGVPAEA